MQGGWAQSGHGEPCGLRAKLLDSFQVDNIATMKRAQQLPSGGASNYESEIMSEKFKVAHIREQGIDLVIIPLNAEFGRKQSSDQQEIIDQLQFASSSAGLAGTVVPVWRDGGRQGFIAPERWHPFFKSISWNQILASVNKELTIS